MLETQRHLKDDKWTRVRTMDIAGWLRNLGLERYAKVFIENAIEYDVLPDLTEGDLEKLGMPLGDRKRLIKAIRATFAGSLGFSTGGVGDTRSEQPSAR